MATNQITREQMINAATDAETLESVVNNEPGVVVTRLGRQIKTVSKVIEDLAATTTTAVTARNEAVEAQLAAEAARDASATSAGGAATSQALASASATQAENSAAAAASGVLGKQTKAILDADLAHAADKIAYVTNDPTEDNNGYYIKLGASGAGSWQKSSYNVKNQIVKMGQLLRNSGAPYPLRSMTRAGITSAENSTWSNLLLDVRVFNARPGEYYQIAYQQNGATLDGEVAYDWIIKAFDAATFATSAAETILIGYQSATYGAQEQITRTGGIQTIHLVPVSRPEMRFDITVNAANLPSAGTVITSNGSGHNGYSWIIDPSCYLLKDTTALRAGDTIPVSSLPISQLIDQGKAFPCRSATRNGITSASNSFLLDAILDVRVIGASADCYYGLRYFVNGSTALAGADPDGWVIHEYPAASYASSDSPTVVINYTHDMPSFPRSGVQTIRLQSPVRSGLEFIVTLDTTKLPAYGTYVRMTVTGDAGYSWIIDPQRYTYSQGGSLPTPSVYYNMSAGGTVRLCWASLGMCYRVDFGPNGANNLPNIAGVYTAPGTDPKAATWVAISLVATDYLPPIRFAAASGGDGEASTFTGGNHLVGGAMTARNVLYQMLVDGRPVTMGVASSGYADRVSFMIANELMASNTVTLGRYCLRQSFAVDFVPGSMEVTAEVHPYEAINVTTDYGPQLVTNGFQGTQLLVGGQQETRIAFDNTATSGAKSSYPNAWAAVFHHETNGQLVSWMDRSYEIGDGRHVAATEPLIRGGACTNMKFYHAAIYNNVTPVAFSAGQKYKWRGGYAWQAPGAQGANFDSVISFRRAGQGSQALVVSASNYTVIP